MALSTLQDTSQIQADIKEMTSELDNLRRLYEQYFLGITKEQPIKSREKLKKLLQRNSGVVVQNATLKFQLQQCVARYNTYSNYWDRILRQIEEGTYQRDVFKTKLHEQERQEKKKTPVSSQAAKESSQEIYQNLFQEYKTIKKQLKQEADTVSFAKFQSQLLGKMKNLKMEDKKNLSFKVVQDGNEIKIKLSNKKDIKS